MMPYAPRTRLLIALFDLTQATEIIDLYSLAEEAGLNLYRTLSEVHTLSHAGLVDARRLRLTAAGLAVAVTLVAQSRERVQAAPAASSKPVARTASTPLTVAPRRAQTGLDTRRQQAQGAVREFLERDLVA